MHTFASRLETSIPAHRACTTSTSDSPSAPRRWSGVRPGEGRKIESLTLVLEGNTPRFPGAPSATMLTYRLAGTTEEIRGPTGTNQPILATAARPDQPLRNRTDARIFARHSEPSPKAPSC